MKKGKTIFLIIYLVFHLVLLIASIVVNLRSEDFQFLFSIRENIGIIVWFSAVGMILFIVNTVLITASTRNNDKREERLRREVNTLKAKIYDLQDASSSSTDVEPNETKKKPAPGKNKEDQ